MGAPGMEHSFARVPTYPHVRGCAARLSTAIYLAAAGVLIADS